MGLAEIADFARNFAVMIRVQGPDPKGLKMRKHAFHQYNFGKTTLSASGMLLSGSFQYAPMAKQINGNNDIQSLSFGLIVTVASVIEPFLSAQHREDMSKQAKPELIPGAQIDIVVEGKVGTKCDVEVLDREALRWLPAKLLTLVDIPASSVAVQSLIETSGSSEHCWEVGWPLASCNNSFQSRLDALRTQVEQSSIHSHREPIRGESSSPILMSKSATRIALLGVSSINFEDLPNLNISTQNRKGDILLAMGSPFGILAPMHFFNSISVGSIANSYPPGSSQRSLLVADIRCLPGMEGAPVLGEHVQLIGILTRPLMQRTSGAEIQLVIPWEAIATACRDVLQDKVQNAWKGIRHAHDNMNARGQAFLANCIALGGSVSHLHKQPNCWPPPSVEMAMSSVCLVTMDNGVWASGILLNNQGLVLTNAHLLEPWRFGKATANGKGNETKSDTRIILPDESGYAGHKKYGGGGSRQALLPTRLKAADCSSGNKHGEYKLILKNSGDRTIRVRLDHADPWIWCDARVVYVSMGPLDVALLQLEFVPDQLCPIVMDFACPLPGSKAYVIGHGLFGPQCDFFPSAFLGVVAKVVEAKRPPSTESCEQVNGQGHFPAMLQTTAAVHPGGSGGAVVNSNGHMIGLITSNARHAGGTVIPHLNFSIPCAALKPIFKFSRDMRDISFLEDLDKPDENLSFVWALMPSLSPKLVPSLPNLPSFLSEDNKKDVRGSRFAKFIAERKDLLNDTAQLGKTETLHNKFIPSKL